MPGKKPPRNTPVKVWQRKDQLPPKIPKQTSEERKSSLGDKKSMTNLLNPEEESKHPTIQVEKSETMTEF